MGTRLADSLAVIVRDAHGNPVPGVYITWVTPNGGTVSPNPSRTTVQGVASAAWVLPVTAGPLSIQARAGTVSADLSAQATPPGPVLDVDVDNLKCGLSLFPRAVRCSAFNEVAMGNWATIAVGGANVCALTTEGSAACWGGLNDLGQLGNGSTVSSRTPVPVAGGRSYSHIAPGSTHSCAVAIDQTAWCWGFSGSGALGNYPGGQVWCGGTPCSPVPIAVRGGVRFRSVVVGRSHSCGVDTGGAAWCWGANFHGQLGDGTTNARDVPVRVAGGLTFTSLSAGAAYTCGVTTSGAAYCWGDNEDGQLGIGTFSGPTPLPAAVTGGLTFANIDAGVVHTCGVTRDGRGYCWGYNVSGQLGMGPAPARASTPQEVRLPG